MGLCVGKADRAFVEAHQFHEVIFGIVPLRISPSIGFERISDFHVTSNHPLDALGIRQDCNGGQPGGALPWHHRQRPQNLLLILKILQRYPVLGEIKLVGKVLLARLVAIAARCVETVGSRDACGCAGHVKTTTQGIVRARCIPPEPIDPILVNGSEHTIGAHHVRIDERVSGRNGLVEQPRVSIDPAPGGSVKPLRTVVPMDFETSLFPGLYTIPSTPISETVRREFITMTAYMKIDFAIDQVRFVDGDPSLAVADEHQVLDGFKFHEWDTATCLVIHDLDGKVLQFLGLLGLLGGSASDKSVR